MKQTKWFAFIAVCKNSHDAQITQYHCISTLIRSHVYVVVQDYFILGLKCIFHLFQTTIPQNKEKQDATERTLQRRGCGTT